MERILTTHVGSLLRPEELKADLVAHVRGESYDEVAFRERLGMAVHEVVRDESATGLDVVNDGEYGKTSWIRYIYNRVSGVAPRKVEYDAVKILSAIPPALLEKIPQLTQGFGPRTFGEYDLYKEVSRFVPFWTGNYSVSGTALCWYCTGPVVYDPTEVKQQLAILSSAVDGVDVAGAFVTAVSPASLYYVVNEYYDSEEEFIFAMAAALKEEYRLIVDAGFILHIDDAVMWHQYATIAMSGAPPEDYATWANLRIDALNFALEGIPRDRVRYHICSGSAHGPKVFDPSLRDILPFVQRVNWGMLLFEAGNVGHEHEWGVWEDFPLDEDRILIPGVVTHHTEMVEHPELVAQRLIRFADVVGRERIMAGTDCGFAQSTMNERVDPWTQWAKLRSLVEGAAIASDRLWKR